MTALDFIVLALAASAIVDVVHNGSILADFLAYCQAKADNDPTDDLDALSSEPVPEVETYPPGRSPLWMRVCEALMPQWVAELIACSYCFSHHTPWVLAVGLYLPGLFVPEPWHWFFKVPLISLAATRLGNIINSCVPRAAQYGRSREEVF